MIIFHSYVSLYFTSLPKGKCGISRLNGLINDHAFNPLGLVPNPQKLVREMNNTMNQSRFPETLVKNATQANLADELGHHPVVRGMTPSKPID